MSDSRFSAPFTAAMPLAEARILLRPLAEKAGERCPCCTQMVRVYRRKLASVPARALAYLYADHGTELAHLPTVAAKRMPGQAHQGGYLALSAHWGLMADEGVRRTDGGRAGYWRVTALGERWLLGETTIPRYAILYDSRCLRLEGAPISMADVLGDGFNLAGLMADSTLARDGAGEPLLFDSEAAA